MLKRAILLVGGPLAALVVTVVTAVVLAGDLPDPIATHWSGGGAPDGHMPLWAFVVATAVLQLVAWGGLLWQARSRGGGLRLTVAPYAWAAIAFLAAIVLVTLTANADAADWRAADEVGFASVLIALAAGALGALAGWLLERGRPLAAEGAWPAGTADDVRGMGPGDPERTPHPGGRPLAPGERAVWSRGLVSRAMVAAAAVLVVGFTAAAIGVGGTNGAGGWALAIGIVAGLAVGLLTEIVVTVDRRGLTIAYGPFGWPRQTVPLAAIAHAEPTVIDPWRLGGWGYRKLARRGGVTAVVLRAGEGLRIVRRDGRELFVTIPDAAGAAALLNALRD